jgi:hypothetical protein
VLDLNERHRAEAEIRDSEWRYREAQAELAHANRLTTYMRAWRVKKFFRDRHFFSSYVSRGPRASAVLHLMARQALCLAALSGQPPEPGGSRRKARGVDGESARRATIGCPAITLQT